MSKKRLRLGHGSGDGLVVTVIAFYYNDQSLNPAVVYIFVCKYDLKSAKIKQKEAEVGPIKNRMRLANV